MNIEETTAPDSTQINADDLIGGPRTFTVKAVTVGSSEQPVNIELVEITDRVYRPGKSMRRVLVAAWGKESSVYPGRRMTLFNDPTVRWGGQAVGGVRISHLSHISGPLTVALTTTRGQRKPFTVQPLPDAPEKTPRQRLQAALTEADLTSAPAALQFISKALGRDVASTKELAADEIELIISALVGGE